MEKNNLRYIGKIIVTGGSQGGQGGFQGGQGGQGGQSGQQGGQSGSQGGQNSFSVPQQYAEKGWAKKVKSLDDVFQQIDTLDALKGKKTVVPDFDKATPAEIEEYFKQTRPKDKSEYVFPENSPKEVSEKVADILFQNGIPKALGNKIIASYAEIEKGIVTQMYSKEGMEAVLKQSFGDDYQKTSGETANLLKKHLSPDDAKILEKISNDHLGLIYRLANNMAKAYGIKEGVASEAGAGSVAGNGDVEATRKSIRAELTSLSQRSHTAEEKQALIKKLEATYK